MKIELVKSLWGMDGSVAEAVERIAAASYDGFEWDLADDPAFLDELRTAKERSGLRSFALIRTKGPDHLASFEREVAGAVEAGADFVSSCSGTDHMSAGEALFFFECALEIERAFEIPVTHETHRTTALFTPWTTAALVDALPDLKLTADYSHWCCVTERMLEDQQPCIDRCRDQVRHVHARVGFPGGPQVNDPRTEENFPYLERHEEWWGEIVKARREAGAETLSFDPEFGPPPYYMPTLPTSGAPVADLWDVCEWMAVRVRALAAQVAADSHQRKDER
jgi:sugar phosphate isomerase/epimerase